MTASPARTKIDVPFRTDAEIRDLVTQFEACTWPYERWTHRAHLAVATVYLQQLAFDEALQRMRASIQEYNRTHNPNGYHETITVFFLRFIRIFLESHPDRQSLVANVEELFERCTMRTPLEYFSPDRLWSAEAKQHWVDPDLKPLPF